MKLFEVKEEEETTEAIEEVNENEEANGEEQNLDSEENQYLIMYLEELGTLPKINENEKLDLYNQAIKGDSVAKNKIIEIYLMEVVEIAKGYVDKGILISDLIQEGNIGLMLSVEGLAGLENATHVEEKIRAGVIASIENVIEENEFINITKKQIVSKVNFLNEGVKNLEEELGRAASIEELAKYMEMSEEEVKDIIRVSDDEIKVKENEEKSNNR
jgi:RNA polymerase primary sigma factor